MCKSIAAAVCIAAAIAVGSAHAKDLKAITLTCNGEATTVRANNRNVENVVDLGVVVNLTDKTVAGLGGIVARINRTDAARVFFAGSGLLPSDPSGASGTLDGIKVTGELDRVTGSISATIARLGSTSSLNVSCKAATRLF